MFNVLRYVLLDDFTYSKDSYTIVAYFASVFASNSLGYMLNSLTLDFVIEPPYEYHASGMNNSCNIVSSCEIDCQNYLMNGILIDCYLDLIKIFKDHMHEKVSHDLKLWLVNVLV